MKAEVSVSGYRLILHYELESDSGVVLQARIVIERRISGEKLLD